MAHNAGRGGGPLPAGTDAPVGCALRDATRTIDLDDPPAHPVAARAGYAAMNAAFLRLPD
jgi:hypothetical protein